MSSSRRQKNFAASVPLHHPMHHHLQRFGAFGNLGTLAAFATAQVRLDHAG
jgi:hypothetical protein